MTWKLRGQSNTQQIEKKDGEMHYDAAEPGSSNLALSSELVSRKKRPPYVTI